ncbi:MAG: hypothetical protein JW703_04275 [Candidatus Diapherotrites archaeon]|nr:hypothetical protein [Candidatus Diapherotrites archaeon]
MKKIVIVLFLLIFVFGCINVNMTQSAGTENSQEQGFQKPPKQQLPEQIQNIEQNETGNGTEFEKNPGDWMNKLPNGIQKIPLEKGKTPSVDVSFDKGKKEFNFDLYGHLNKEVPELDFSADNDEQECIAECDTHCANMLTACKGNCDLAFNSACVAASAPYSVCMTFCGPIPACQQACQNAFEQACDEDALDACKDSCETINENDCIEPCYNNC